MNSEGISKLHLVWFSQDKNNNNLYNLDYSKTMCGICGFYGLNDKNLLKRMSHIMNYRGPDDSGLFIDNNIGIANQRLSIIDLKKGHQPIHNEDGSIFITFNGEIYNFKELKSDLEKRGHRFYSDSDTEVIVHAYEEYGNKCVSYFNGMFAFALWDSNKKKLLLARDRLGIKPLYYILYNEKLIFASEIKSILQYEEFKKEINYTALNNFFTFRYVLGEKTILKGINRLLPGHILIYKNNQIKISKYWDLDFCPTNEKIDYYTNSLKHLVGDSVKKRLTSDVPLGVFLSGGIDSTSILSYANEFSDKQVKTFNLSFCDWPNNELKYAKCASEFFNTNHKEVTVTPDIIKLLPKIVWHMDEPVADPTAILNYVLAEKAKSSVKVILTGEGADEVFAGYEQYKIMNLTKNYSKIVPKIVQKNLIQGLVNLLPKESFFIKLSNYLSTISNTPKSYVELLSIFDKSEKKLLYSNHLIKKAGNLNSDLKLVSCYFKNSYDLLNKMLLSDIKTWLPNNMLIKLDRMSMAHSIEARVPFLDHRIVEFSSKIPSRLKLKGLNEKFILKKSMENKIPKNILKRKKQRFFVPLDFWFKNNLDYITSNIFLDSDFLKKNFNKKFILKLLDYQKSSSHKTILKHNQLLRLYYPRQIWNLITLAMWHKTYIENDSTKPLNILSI